MVIGVIHGYKWLHMVIGGCTGLYMVSPARLLNIRFAARMQCSL